jgi:hypothetical protein
MVIASYKDNNLKVIRDSEKLSSASRDTVDVELDSAFDSAPITI